jgi:AcrR family transcriptional regulator
VEAILQAAVEEFALNGYEGASIDSIAKRAGVSKGGFYYHFTNKEVLLLEATAKLSQPIMVMMDKAMADCSPSHGLIQFISEYLNYWTIRPTEMGFYSLSMAKALQSPALMELYREYIKQSTEFYVGMFQKAVEMGESDVEDVGAYGISLMSALDGMVVYAIASQDYDIEDITRRFSKIWIGKVGVK